MWILSLEPHPSFYKQVLFLERFLLIEVSADGLFWSFDIPVFLALDHFLSVQLYLFSALR